VKREKARRACKGKKREHRHCIQENEKRVEQEELLPFLYNTLKKGRSSLMGIIEEGSKGERVSPVHPVFRLKKEKKGERRKFIPKGRKRGGNANPLKVFFENERGL